MSRIVYNIILHFYLLLIGDSSIIQFFLENSQDECLPLIPNFPIGHKYSLNDVCTDLTQAV